ncbi:RDD family protein [Pseudoalteromonas ruthenica]|uniref:RDD domain-containing protein n=1 Tax=Pseudoalteromonas ruthenica TaxID=151081 RepID=A0A0F4PRL4_9GAMM|nr:RDD family protein [Pseudoalteromonas ruthenica]KJY98115.1 hypothetical protein TW76_06185 [Pseudoalteromonas ruthenica]KJZ02182.1 hypothetical protein TW72_00395 [Pseudoalteromonas ruthenica]TMO92010.1 RDD family protein [Pseudoalteromonas ruthenica]TMO99607.1 RDD family protein [Pseudoalteromonas ruthenica]TMP06708.1 RDD family protein [Pseudoalteromonas ruthenica]
MKDNKTAALRIPAFFIDAAFVVAALVGLLELLLFTSTIKEPPAVELVMFVCVPVGFFVYWALNINLGKRIFKLVIVDELSEEKASIWQLFLRSILFCMLVSFNIVLLLPLFFSKKNQGLHDMLAKTRVIKRTGEHN